jgi:hypothetical protein
MCTNIKSKFPDAVKSEISFVKTDVLAVRKEQSLQHHQAVMKWLSPEDFAAQQHDIISRKEEGTGQWFLASVVFKAWQQGPKKTLFCPDIPGLARL